MTKKPEVSLIIPHRETESIQDVLNQVREFEFPTDQIEILTVTGNHPSVQRNACIREASGKYIYFLDNDSEPDSANIRKALEIFADESVAVLGGPNHSREGDSEIQKDFSYCLSSIFGVGPVSNRYRASGEVREATDRDLILCNMMIRKSVLDELGAFNEKLYPNEENELLNRIADQGYKLIYHPEFLVQRSPRSNIRSFIKMLLGYGAGRFKQMVLSFRFSNLLFFVPALFSLYIVTLPFAWMLPVPDLYKGMYYSLAVLYAGLLSVSGILAAFRMKGRRHRGLFSIPSIFFLIHFFYGAGIWRGFLRYLKGESERKIQYRITRRNS